MIVCCPSCHTRYRHRAGDSAAMTAQCSRCDESFTLPTARRPYVVLPPRGVAGLETAAAMGGPSPGAMPTGLHGIPSETSAWFEIALALVPTGTGAVLAYYVANAQGADPVSWAAMGGAIGLLLGWSCLLWMRPQG